MKAEMNPDLEFLRGLRERLRLRADKFSGFADAEKGGSIERAILSVVSFECRKIQIETEDYLKNRGIE